MRENCAFKNINLTTHCKEKASLARGKTQRQSNVFFLVGGFFLFNLPASRKLFYTSLIPLVQCCKSWFAVGCPGVQARVLLNLTRSMLATIYKAGASTNVCPYNKKTSTLGKEADVSLCSFACFLLPRGLQVNIVSWQSESIRSCSCTVPPCLDKDPFSIHHYMNGQESAECKVIASVRYKGFSLDRSISEG